MNSGLGKVFANPKRVKNWTDVEAFRSILCLRLISTDYLDQPISFIQRSDLHHSCVLQSHWSIVGEGLLHDNVP